MTGWRHWRGAPTALGQSWRRDRDRWLLGLALAALIATLWRPSIPMRRALFDHVVVFDITQSMDVKDLTLDGAPASRLTFAKRAWREALVQLPCGSKIGWGVFTEYRSFLLIAPTEVCANLNELRGVLDHIDGRMAWTGNSEVAKGLYAAIGIAHELPDKPSLVFVTDGQEAPPLNPRHRPPFKGEPGAVPGLVVGVGGTKLSPIPKSDPSGRPLGVWGADEVMQTDPRSQGRGGSVGHEQLVEDADGPSPAAGIAGATPGSEHLSSLREPYLKLIAAETGLGYHRLEDREALLEAITAPALARPVPTRLDLRGVFGALAVVLLLARHVDGLRAAWRRHRAAPPARR